METCREEDDCAHRRSTAAISIHGVWREEASIVTVLCFATVGRLIPFPIHGFSGDAAIDLVVFCFLAGGKTTSLSL
jgi:hypothetical protein